MEQSDLMRALRSIPACALAGLIAGTCHAADNGVYAGASLGRVNTDLSNGLDSALDGKDTGFKLMVGLRPLDWLGVEMSYVDLGEVKQKGGASAGSSFKFDEAGFAASGILFWDIATFDLFAKAGLLRWDTGATIGTPLGTVRQDDAGTDLTWGVGAQARFGSLAARLEYEKFEIDTPPGFDSPDMISLGVTWTFF